MDVWIDGWMVSLANSCQWLSRCYFCWLFIKYGGTKYHHPLPKKRELSTWVVPMQKFETCPCWWPLLLTHYCYIVVGREYHLWSYNFFSSHLVKWCYIYILYTYIVQYDICIYIYICIHHIILWWYFSPAGHFCFGPFWESCFPWAFPGHHAFTNAMTAAQIVERRHKEGKTKLHLGVSSRSFHSSPPYTPKN